MKISLYSESPDPGPGGAEQFIAVLAEGLSERHEVCIVHHKAAEAENAWGEYAGCNLSRVRFRYVARTEDASPLERTWWGRYRAARAWRAEVTSDCDIFIGLLHNKPPFCRAPTGVVIVLFPTYDPFRGLEDSLSKRRKQKPTKPRPDRGNIFKWPLIRRLYARWEWQRRLTTYPVKLAISEFSRQWTRARWGCESELLHPPVAVPERTSIAKENRIISVGRFATTGHTKKQIELLQMFASLRAELPDWSYSTVGGLNETPQDEEYYRRACEFRDGERVEVEANVTRVALDQLYASAKIFWHAAGLGDDLATQPEMAEHFGLVTVEAMARGCVPVVVRLGGQPEIIEHGITGFLFDSLGELAAHTRTLANDPALLRRMSEVARERAEDFSREACLRNLLRHLDL